MPWRRFGYTGKYTMILSNMKDWPHEKSAFHAVFHQAIDYVAHHDLAALDVGKYQIIPDTFFFMIQTYPTIELSESKPESHIQYIDLQYLLAGEENIGFSRVDHRVQIVEDKSQSNDMLYYQMDAPQNVLTLKPGDFCIFFPNDIHRTRGQVSTPVTIKKAVFKIHLDLLK